MTGHQSILAMRRNGLRPAYVWVSDFPNALLDGLTVRVAGDMPEVQDFRFLKGVTAIVEGPDAGRVERITAACQEFASRVIASTYSGRRVAAITDSEGTMTWPK